MLTIPPVFCSEDLGPDLLDNLQHASCKYCTYAYTHAFDDLFLVAERRNAIESFLAGELPSTEMAANLRQWLLRRWSSTRSLGNGRMNAVALALGNIRKAVADVPANASIENVDRSLLMEMTRIFKHLDDCLGVGPTIASKLLAPLRPALFPMWDNPIAAAYGFALNSAGYRQYLNITRDIAIRARQLWKQPTSLEAYLKPSERQWIAPLAKVIDEWNWIRITRKHAFDVTGR